MAKAKYRIEGPGREPVEVDAYAVRPNPGERGAFVVQGIDRTGRAFRVPIPGATVNGKAVEAPTPDEQRAAAPEAPNEANGRARAAAEAGGAAAGQPSRPPARAAPKG